MFFGTLLVNKYRWFGRYQSNERQVLDSPALSYTTLMHCFLPSYLKQLQQKRNEAASRIQRFYRGVLNTRALIEKYWGIHNHHLMMRASYKKSTRRIMEYVPL